MKTVIVPAIDVINGECVRLSKGDYSQKTKYFSNPAEVAKRYEDMGVKRLHLVDLDGAKASQPVNLAVLEKIKATTNLEVQFGGGIKNTDALKSVFNAGASRAICGSIAVSEPKKFIDWLNEFGTEKIILGADVRNGMLAVNGWEEQTDLSVDSLLNDFLPHGLSQVICTDISKDGMLQGPSFELYSHLKTAFTTIDFTVSGGISSMADIEQVNEMGMPYVIVGKAIYENKISDEQLKQWSFA